MGYYSFYKIIKDVIRTIFGNKFLRLLFIFAICFIFVSFYNSVNASFDFDYNNTSYSFPDFPKSTSDFSAVFICAVGNQPGNFYLIYSDTDIVYSNNNIQDSSLPFNAYRYSCENNGSTWFGTNTLTRYNLMPQSWYPIWSTTKLYSKDGSLIFDPNPFIPPAFGDTSANIESLNFTNLFININDFDISNNNLYLHVLQINNTVTENNEILYYYGDHIIKLSQNDKYYKQLLDTSVYYFSIPKSKLNFNTDTSYLLVLDNSSALYENSQGLIEKNVEQNIYDVQEIDTAGILTQAEVDHNNFLNMQESLQDIQNSVNDNTITNETSDNVSIDMNFSNNNTALNNLNNGFFTRLTSELNQIIDYNLNNVSYITLPVPFTNQSITIGSDIVSAHIPNTLITIFNTMWLYLFTFYLYKFINKIYISFKTGNILNAFNSNDEIITSSML